MLGFFCVLLLLRVMDYQGVVTMVAVNAIEIPSTVIPLNLNIAIFDRHGLPVKLFLLNSVS